MSLKLDLFVTIISVVFELPAEAHDIYSQLRDTRGASCCDERDCRPAPYRVTPTGVQMYVEGDWLEVPDGTIQYRSLPGDTGETRGGHWCGTVREGGGDRVRYLTHCAVLPPNSASASDGHHE
jgi:hypothetical protein